MLAEHRRSRRCRVLLVDETSMRKRHRYVSVIVNGDTGQTLAMVEHRNAAALSAFLMQQGHRWCKGVKVVVSDGSKAYKSAIGAHLGHARHVLDRFHVIRWFSAGLTQVRRDIQRRPEGSKPAFDPEVFRARFALLRRGDTLTDADRARLDALFDAHPRLKGPTEAPRPLPRRRPPRLPRGPGTVLRPLRDRRAARVPRIVDTIIARSDEILNWHHSDRASNGRIEGMAASVGALVTLAACQLEIGLGTSPADVDPQRLAGLVVDAEHLHIAQSHQSLTHARRVALHRDPPVIRLL